MTDKLRHIERLWLIITLAVYALASYLIMPNIDNTAGLGKDNTAYYYIAAFAVSVPYLFITLRRILCWGQSKTIWFFILFFIWATAATCMSLEGVSHIVYISFTILPLLISYTYFRRYESDRFLYTIFFASLLLVSYQYFQIYQIANLVDVAHIGVSYFSLILLPLVLLHPSRLVRIIAWVVTSIVIVSAIKRGGILTLVIGALVYVWCRQFISERRNLAVLLAIIGLGVFAYGIYYMVTFLESDILERFLHMQEDQGSGRLEIWQTVIEDLRQSDTTSFLVGHGYRSVNISIGYESVPAHNDFLEVFYDFGLVGLMLYLVAWFYLIRDAIRLLRQKSPYAPTFCMMVACFFALSMVSIVIYYFWVTYFAIMIGLILGQRELELSQAQPCHETVG